MSAVRDVFAAAAGRYGQGNPLLALERPETERLIGDVRALDVLDLGAGTGHYAAWAAAQGARRAVAVDFTREMLRGATWPAVVADAARLPFRDRSFDLVVGALLLSFVPDRAAVLREAARLLRVGGALVLSDLHEVASARGWSRSFTGPQGERLVIDAPPPRMADVQDELLAAGFGELEVRQPVIDERLEGEFVRAGRRDFGTLRGTPLLALFRARRGGDHAA